MWLLLGRAVSSQASRLIWEILEKVDLKIWKWRGRCRGATCTDMCQRILTSGAVVSEAPRWLGLEELGYALGGWASWEVGGERADV